MAQPIVKILSPAGSHHSSFLSTTAFRNSVEIALNGDLNIQVTVVGRCTKVAISSHLSLRITDSLSTIVGRVLLIANLFGYITMRSSVWL